MYGSWSTDEGVRAHMAESEVKTEDMMPRPVHIDRRESIAEADPALFLSRIPSVSAVFVEDDNAEENSGRFVATNSMLLQDEDSEYLDLMSPSQNDFRNGGTPKLTVASYLMGDVRTSDNPISAYVSPSPRLAGGTDKRRQQSLLHQNHLMGSSSTECVATFLPESTTKEEPLVKSSGCPAGARSGSQPRKGRRGRNSSVKRSGSRSRSHSTGASGCGRAAHSTPLNPVTAGMRSPWQGTARGFGSSVSEVDSMTISPALLRHPGYTKTHTAAPIIPLSTFHASSDNLSTHSVNPKWSPKANGLVDKEAVLSKLEDSGRQAPKQLNLAGTDTSLSAMTFHNDMDHSDVAGHTRNSGIATGGPSHEIDGEDRSAGRHSAQHESRYPLVFRVEESMLRSQAGNTHRGSHAPSSQQGGHPTESVGAVSSSNRKLGKEGFRRNESHARSINDLSVAASQDTSSRLRRTPSNDRSSPDGNFAGAPIGYGGDKGSLVYKVVCPRNIIELHYLDIPKSKRGSAVETVASDENAGMLFCNLSGSSRPRSTGQENETGSRRYTDVACDLQIAIEGGSKYINDDTGEKETHSTGATSSSITLAYKKYPTGVLDNEMCFTQSIHEMLRRLKGSVELDEQSESHSQCKSIDAADLPESASMDTFRKSGAHTDDLAANCEDHIFSPFPLVEADSEPKENTNNSNVVKSKGAPDDYDEADDDDDVVLINPSQGVSTSIGSKHTRGRAATAMPSSFPGVCLSDFSGEDRDRFPHTNGYSRLGGVSPRLCAPSAPAHNPEVKGTADSVLFSATRRLKPAKVLSVTSIDSEPFSSHEAAGIGRGNSFVSFAGWNQPRSGYSQLGNGSTPRKAHSAIPSWARNERSPRKQAWKQQSGASNLLWNLQRLVIPTAVVKKRDVDCGIIMPLFSSSLKDFVRTVPSPTCSMEGKMESTERRTSDSLPAFRSQITFPPVQSCLVVAAVTYQLLRGLICLHTQFLHTTQSADGGGSAESREASDDVSDVDVGVLYDGFSHNDLHLGNYLIDFNTGRVSVCDFELVSHLPVRDSKHEAAQRTTQLRDIHRHANGMDASHTGSYESKEHDATASVRLPPFSRQSPHGLFTETSDTWALALTTLELLTGVSPLLDDNMIVDDLSGGPLLQSCFKDAELDSEADSSDHIPFFSKEGSLPLLDWQDNISDHIQWLLLRQDVTGQRLRDVKKSGLLGFCGVCLANRKGARPYPANEHLLAMEVFKPFQNDPNYAEEVVRQWIAEEREPSKQ